MVKFAGCGGRGRAAAWGLLDGSIHGCVQWIDGTDWRPGVGLLPPGTSSPARTSCPGVGVIPAELSHLPTGEAHALVMQLHARISPCACSSTV